MEIIKIAKYLKLIIIFLLIINLYIFSPNSIQFQKNYLLSNKINSIDTDEIKLFFNSSPLKYCFSYKYNIIEVEFNIKFYNKNKNLIIPSDLSFYNELHILCHIKKKNNINIDSLSNIYNNKYYKCIEYFQINETFRIGFKIYKNRDKIKTISLFSNKNINYNNYLFKDDNKLNPLIINKNYYLDLSHIIKNTNDNNPSSLKKLYISNPNYSPKYKIKYQRNLWYFKNIFNNYFCFCIGKNCLKKKNIYQECKYKFYLNIIDNNRFLYNKTHYLFADFLLENIATGDAYLVFKEMIKKNLPALYVTSRNDIYKEYINDNNNKIIYLKNQNYNITGDTLEKYLNLFLRLKAVVSGAEFYSIYNIFYYIEYITFICLGHGVNYFKPFLYNDYYGKNRFNKIVLPSDTIIKVAKKYGWEDNNIIKIGLPRWDLFDNNSMKIDKLSKIQKILLNKSIFIMFTWRALNKGKEISPYYFNNIFKLITNSELNKALENYNITLFISLHHNLLTDKNFINSNKRIKYVNQENIIDCLINSSLIISDFSSVIFDLIYQNKPFIIYIPDSEDKDIGNLYTKEYLDIINCLKNGSIYFKNKYFDVKRTINKIIYYIKHNFKIEKKLKEFYTNFKFKGKNHINKFIHYLNNMT